MSAGPSASKPRPFMQKRDDVTYVLHHNPPEVTAFPVCILLVFWAPPVAQLYVLVAPNYVLKRARASDNSQTNEGFFFFLSC